MSSFPTNSGRLSGERWNYRRDRLVKWYFETRAMLVEQFTMDGFPPFTEKLSPIATYMNLLAQQQSGQLSDPQALAELQVLSQRYGAPAPTRLSPFAGAETVSAGAQAQAAFHAQPHQGGLQ